MLSIAWCLAERSVMSKTMKMKIALVQQRALPDRDANLQRGLQAVSAAAGEGAQVICFSELAFDPFYPQERATPE